MTYFNYHSSDDSLHDLEWERAYQIVRVVLRLLLNLSTDSEFHLPITKLFTQFFVNFAYENEHSFDLAAASHGEFEKTKQKGMKMTQGSQASHASFQQLSTYQQENPFFDDELAILSCKILTNLGKSVDGTIRLRLYKAQLKLVNNKSSSPQKTSLSGGDLSQPSITSQYKNDKIDEKAEVAKYLKKNLCPAWFNHYFVASVGRRKGLTGKNKGGGARHKQLEAESTFDPSAYNGSLTGGNNIGNNSHAEILSIDGSQDGGSSVDSSYVADYDNVMRLQSDLASLSSVASRSIIVDNNDDNNSQLLPPITGNDNDMSPEEKEAKDKSMGMNVISSMQNLMFSSAKDDILGETTQYPKSCKPDQPGFPNGGSVNSSSEYDLYSLASSQRITAGNVYTVDIPEQKNPWEPPIIMQVMEKDSDVRKKEQITGTTMPQPDMSQSQLHQQQQNKLTMSETVVLDPSRKYSRITFKTAIDQFGRFKQYNHAKSGAPVTLWRWQHVPGSVISNENHKFIESLDGKTYIYYDSPNALSSASSNKHVFMPVFNTEHPGNYPEPPVPKNLTHVTGATIPSPYQSLKPSKYVGRASEVFIILLVASLLVGRSASFIVVCIISDSLLASQVHAGAALRPWRRQQVPSVRRPRHRAVQTGLYDRPRFIGLSR